MPPAWYVTDPHDRRLVQTVEADAESTARWVAWTAWYGSSARIDDRDDAHYAALDVIAGRGDASPVSTPQGAGALVDARGRKYLTAEERARFLAAVRAHRQPTVQTLARTLALTGCPRERSARGPCVRRRPRRGRDPDSDAQAP